MHRSDLAGWAEYGCCAAHSRYFRGLRLHLVCALGGLPVCFALTGAKADDRQTQRARPRGRGIVTADPALTADRPCQTLIADKNYFGADFEHTLAQAALELPRPARKGKPSAAAPRCSSHCARPSSRSAGPSKPARPGTTWWTHPSRSHDPGPTVRTRPDHHDLAQRQDRTARQAITGRLRSLTPRN
ncbi:hypothetical protein [Actinophytocola sp.]|uniref:hypothetical protein n=1 Tax=Actinophytocola sp. TaxID=1872138 RepID=UPI00345B9037